MGHENMIGIKAFKIMVKSNLWEIYGAMSKFHKGATQLLKGVFQGNDHVSKFQIWFFSTLFIFVHIFTDPSYALTYVMQKRYG